MRGFHSRNITKARYMNVLFVFRKEYTAQGGPGTEITDAIPSLDMRPVLALFSPEDAFLRIESCSGCGGHLEIVTKETKRVARLTKRIRCLVAVVRGWLAPSTCAVSFLDARAKVVATVRYCCMAVKTDEFCLLLAHIVVEISCQRQLGCLVQQHLKLPFSRSVVKPWKPNLGPLLRFYGGV